MSQPTTPTSFPHDVFRDRLLKLSDQLRAVATTIHPAGSLGDTAREMYKIAPMLTDTATAMDAFENAIKRKRIGDD
jgi:hypothetical protein